MGERAAIIIKIGYRNLDEIADAIIRLSDCIKEELDVDIEEPDYFPEEIKKSLYEIAKSLNTAKMEIAKIQAIRYDSC